MCWSFFNCCCVYILLDSVFIHPHCDLKVRNCMDLQFVPVDKVVGKDNTWCQTLCQFIYWSIYLSSLFPPLISALFSFLFRLFFLPTKRFSTCNSITVYIPSAVLWHCLVFLKSFSFMPDVTDVCFVLKFRPTHLPITFQQLGKIK